MGDQKYWCRGCDEHKASQLGKMCRKCCINRYKARGRNLNKYQDAVSKVRSAMDKLYWPEN